MAPTVSNAVWNLTIPDTSPLIGYGSDFVRQCPSKNGILDCTSGSAHISNSTTASLTINFFGTAIYLFGSVGSGSTYTTRLDTGPDVDGTVKDENLLASYTGLRNSPEGEPLHGLVLTVTQFKPEDFVLAFTGAIISVDTGSPSAQTTLTNYDLTKPDSGVRLTPGWTHNGSYIQSGSDFAQQATLSFKGSAVMVYGLCSDTLQSFGNEFGQVLTDTSPFGIAADVVDSSKSSGPYVTNNCLLYADTSLGEGEHNITYDSTRDNILLSSFQVLSVDAPKNSSVPPAIAKPKGGNSTSPDAGDANDLAIGIGGVVGIVAAAVGVVIFLIVGILCLRRRRRQRATMYPIPSAQSLPMSETYPKPDDDAVVSQDALPVQSFTPSFTPALPQQRPSSARYGAAARLAVPVSQPAGRARPQVPTIATAGPAAVVQGAGEESPEDPYADPYAGMASYHADPFAAVGGRTVLTAEGMHTLEDPELAQKARREAARAAPVNRVGESSGSSGSRASRRQSVRPDTVMTRSSQALPDFPPPLYEETDNRI